MGIRNAAYAIDLGLLKLASRLAGLGERAFGLNKYGVIRELASARIVAWVVAIACVDFSEPNTWKFLLALVGFLAIHGSVLEWLQANALRVDIETARGADRELKRVSRKLILHGRGVEIYLAILSCYVSIVGFLFVRSLVDGTGMRVTLGLWLLAIVIRNQSLYVWLLPPKPPRRDVAPGWATPSKA